MTSSRRRPVVIVAVLALAAAGAGWLIYQRAGARPPSPTAVKTPAGPDLRANLPPWAQDPDALPGTVVGTVWRSGTGSSRTPVAGAVVVLFPELAEATGDPRWKPAATARSGSDGRFRLTPVRPGEYGITASADGLLGAHRAGLSVLPGTTVEGIELLLEPGGVTLEGRVSDAGGGPIPGAELRLLAALMGQKQTRTFQAFADSEGKYRITAAKASYWVVADADGYAPSSRMLDLNAIRTADFALTPAARLAGRVVEKAGQARVASASVRLDQGQIWWQPSREITADGEGRFEFRDLDPGAYRVSAHKGNLVGAPMAVEVAALDRSAEVLLELHAGQNIAGRAVKAAPGGAPLAGAHIRLGQGPMGMPGRIRATTSADGSFRIEGVLPERYNLSAESAGHAPASREVVLSSGGGDVSGVELVLAPEAAVSGTVVSAEGAPVVGATVTGWLFETAAGPTGRWASDLTDARGAFRLGSLAAGQLRIEAQQPDLGRASHGPEPMAAGAQKTVKLTLQPGATVSGKVRWSDGQPASGVNVLGIVPASMGMVQAKTGADGAYTLGPLPPGEAMVTASRLEGLAAMTQIDPKAAETVTLEGNQQKRGVDLMLERGGHRLTGIVLAPDGKPLGGARVRADRGDNPAQAMRAAMGGMFGDKPVLSGDDGRFVLDDLEAGPYTVTAQSTGLPGVTVANVPTDARDVRVQFARAAVLAGVAVDQAGQPIPDFTVSASESEGPADSESQKTARALRGMAAMMGGAAPTVHDPSGAFEVGGLEAGSYDLLVSTADGKIGRLRGIAVAAGERKAGLRVAVKAGATLRGKLVDFPGGQPLPGVMVIVMGDQKPIMRTSGADGAFTIEGLPGGGSVSLGYGGPMTGFVQDHRTVKVPAEVPAVDLGQVRLLRGEALFGKGDSNLGLRTKVGEGSPEIVFVARGGPAEAAGLKRGERIAAVDGHPVDGLGQNSLEQLMNKNAGVELSVLSPGSPTPRKVPVRPRQDNPASN